MGALVDHTVKRGASALLALLFASVALGSLLPVYTDEVGWRFQLSRYFQDGGVDRFIAEGCGANTVATPAIFMLPVRAFSSILTAFFSDPAAIRLSGVAFALLGIVGLRRLIRSVVPDPRRRATVELLAYALLGLGMLPLLMVWSRPEQPIWLALLGSLLIAAGQHDQTRGPREPVLRIALIAALAMVAMSYHLKSLIYLPVFAVAIVIAGRPSRQWHIRATAFAVLAIAAWLAYRYWSARFACPGDPVLAARLAKENASILLLGKGWGATIQALPHIAKGASPRLYLEQASPAAKYMSEWLPATPLSPALLAIWKRWSTIAWYCASAAGGATLLFGVRQTGWRLPLLWIAGALTLSATAWAVLQLNKNAYESALYLPVIALALTLILGAAPREPRWLIVVVLPIAAVSFMSQMLLIGNYAPKLWQANRADGYIADQPYSLAPYGYAMQRRHILEAGAKCGFGPDRSGDRLLVDDLTYFAYAQRYRPFHRLGLLSDWNGSIRDPLEWLRQHGSPGGVIGCRYLPPGLRSRAVATGPYCCFSTR